MNCCITTCSACGQPIVIRELSQGVHSHLQCCPCGVTPLHYQDVPLSCLVIWNECVAPVLPTTCPSLAPFCSKCQIGLSLTLEECERSKVPDCERMIGSCPKKSADRSPEKKEFDFRRTHHVRLNDGHAMSVKPSPTTAHLSRLK